MARPAKAAQTLTGHITKAELEARSAVEDAARGGDDKIAAPEWLNDGQREVFGFVVKEFEASKILGNIDVYVLTQFAVATERMFAIEADINDRPDAVKYDKDLIFARNSYVKDFWRGASELSLSPQARAKIGTLNLLRNEEEKDPVKRVLESKG